MKTFTIKFETISGTIKTAKYTGKDLDAALDTVCRDKQVGNILEAHDGYRNRVL